MRRRVLALVVLAATLAGCTRGLEEAAEVLDSPRPSESGSPSAVVPVTPSATTSPSGDETTVRAPRSGDEVLSPVVVRGLATADDGQVVVRILGADGSEPAAMNVPVDRGASRAGSFRASLAFFVPERQAGTIQVFEVGPGGLVEDLVEVSVTLVPGV